jgi:hypothetical protein
MAHPRAACLLAAVLLLSLSLPGCGGRASAPEKTTAAEDLEYKLPDDTSPPRPGSERARALAALDRTRGLTLYSLQPWFPPRPDHPAPAYNSPGYKTYALAQSAAWEKSQREWCAVDECLHDNKVLGHTIVPAGDSLHAVTRAVRESLGKVPSYASACIPEYRHAIEFDADGHHYLVLLCYGCGQVAVAIDGDLSGDEQTYDMGDEAALDAVLKAAGIPLAQKSSV